MFFAQNTIDCGQQVSTSRAPQNGTNAATTPEEENQQITFKGNIFYECLDNAANLSPYRFESQNENWIITHAYNVDYRSVGGNITLQVPPLMDIFIGNLTNINPLIVNPTNTLAGNYHLQLTSPALKIVPEPEPYTLFRTMYGLDIRQDISGKVWGSGANLNPGAFQ